VQLGYHISRFDLRAAGVGLLEPLECYRAAAIENDFDAQAVVLQLWRLEAAGGGSSTRRGA
jgi:hypothetical protein